MNVASVISCSALAQVIVHRSGAQTAGEGGKPVDTTTENEAISMQVEKLSAGQAARAFGDDSIAKWRGTTDSDADVLENDLIEITSGPYDGTVLEVKGTRVPGGMLMVVELADTKRTPST